ncbi:MAG: carbohydrate ABC transporter permease [Burkholderiales bacterium]|nr:carbohydrate ABC transporter permease [Anaerolineae bacterium]
MSVSSRLRGINGARVVFPLISLVVLLPLIYQVGISFKNPQQIFSTPVLPFTFPPSFENYVAVLTQMNIPRFLFNSLVFSLGVTLGQLILAIPAAFSFAYFNFRFKNLLLGIVLISLMVPFVVTYIPNYLLLAQWRMINTLHGMILPMLGISLGFGIFLLRQHFMSFPREVMEAAHIDGANSWDVLWRVLLPANLSPVVTVGLYVLINSWNQFIWPLLVGGGNPNSFTLTVAVQIFYTSPEGGDYWGAIMAASVLTSLPTVLIFLLMRKRILTTFVEGAVKG